MSSANQASTAATSIYFLNPRVISICGPFPPTQAQNQSHTRTRIHNSDYIDFNDQTLFAQIVDRIDRSPMATLQFWQYRTAKSFIISPFTFTLRKPDPDPDPCPICREELKTSSLISKLPCTHLFHFECIMPWLYRSCVCPMCRFELPKEKVSGPLRRYTVTVGNECVVGCGGDRESAFWDAVSRNGLDLRAIPDWLLGPTPMGLVQSWSASTSVGQVEMESIGLESSSKTVTEVRRERVGEVGAWGLTIDEDGDGDTIMTDAWN